MNESVEREIKSASQHLLQQIALYGHGQKAREAQAELDKLRKQRTEADHAEMARRMGLPVVGGAA